MDLEGFRLGIVRYAHQLVVQKRVARLYHEEKIAPALAVLPVLRLELKQGIFKEFVVLLQEGAVGSDQAPCFVVALGQAPFEGGGVVPPLPDRRARFVDPAFGETVAERIREAESGRVGVIVV